jgi:hypothetical protein
VLKRICTSVIAAAAVVLTLGSSGASATADIPELSIGTIGYNARGADTEANRNSEYVDIANTSDAAVNVKDLLVRDSWAKGQNAVEAGACNTFKVASLPGVTTGEDGAVMLPAGHVIRVYSGSGTPKVFGPGGKWHAVYKNSTCGYNGHYWNNLGDTAWITLGAVSKFKRYDFRFGYYVR